MAAQAKRAMSAYRRTWLIAALLYVKSIAARKKQRQAQGPWQRISHKRNCYCGVWDTEPAAYEKAGYPLGFCGVCERCGAPGHTRHFPGPVPYTSAWCDKCYRTLAWTWPFRSRAGWGLLLVAAMLLALPVNAVYHYVVRKNFVATMQQEVGRSVNDEQSYRLRHRDWLRVTRALPNGNKEERYADNGREDCLLLFELNGGKVVKWHFQEGCRGRP
jgi:hypothetical protein